MRSYFNKVANIAFGAMVAMFSFDASEAMPRSQSDASLHKHQSASIPRSRSCNDLLLHRKKLSGNRAEKCGNRAEKLRALLADQEYKTVCTHSDGSDINATQRTWVRDVGVNSLLVTFSRDYSDGDCDPANCYSEEGPEMLAIKTNYCNERIREVATELTNWWFRDIYYSALERLLFFQNPIKYLHFIKDISVRRFAREEIVNTKKVCSMTAFFLELSKRKMSSFIDSHCRIFISHEFPYFLVFEKLVVDLTQQFNAAVTIFEQEDKGKAILQVQALINNDILPMIFKIKGVGACLYLQILKAILDRSLFQQTFEFLEWIHDVFLLFQTSYLVWDIQVARDLFNVACLKAGYYRELETELSDGDEWDEADRAARGLTNE